MPERQLGYTPGPPKLLMSGNEATAIGALHAGCRYFAGYPITPSTEILQFLDDGRNAQEALGRIGAAWLDPSNRDVGLELEAFLEERVRACVRAGMVLGELIEIGDLLQQFPWIRHEHVDLGQ